MKGVYEKMPGSGIWYVRYADMAGRMRKEKAGTKSAAGTLYINRSSTSEKTARNSAQTGDLVL